MSSIAFTDDIGAATLTPPVPAPASRFRGWTPRPQHVGDRSVVVGTGETIEWIYRTDYLASFIVPYLRQAELAVALRLIEHLLGGGECTVTLGDTSSHVYTCILAPGSMPALQQADARMIEFELSLALKNVDDSPLLADF